MIGHAQQESTRRTRAIIWQAVALLPQSLKTKSVMTRRLGRGWELKALLLASTAVVLSGTAFAADLPATA